MPSFELNKRDLKLLDELNQICKYLMVGYHITKDLKVFSQNESFEPSLGLHFAELPCQYFDNSLFCNNDIINMIELCSKSVFSTFKLFKKKEMSQILVTDSIIYLTDINDRNSVIGKLNKNIDDKKYVTLFKSLIESEYCYNLKEEEVTDLVQNNIIILQYHKFKVRTTRELTPNLKKDDTVELYFIEKNEGLMTIMFKIKKPCGIITYHVYNAINF